MTEDSFFIEECIPGLFGQVLGSNQAQDFSGAPYFLLPANTSGNVSSTVISKSANYTLTSSDGIALVTSGASGVTVTLPTAVGIAGRRYDIKKVDNGIGILTINTTSSQTIDGQLNQYIPYQYYSLTVVSNGANWFLI